MPASLDIETRLKDLESIIGQAVFLADQPQKEPECVPKEDESRVVQRKEGKTSSSTNASIDCVTPLDTPASSGEEEIDDMPPFSELKIQDLSDEDVAFCPWKLVKGYADYYTGKANRERVRPFFDNALKDRDWYFFYIRDTTDPKKAHLLVSSRQVENLLSAINRALGTELTVPYGPSRRAFFLRFTGCGPFRPRFLLHHKRHAPAAATGSGLDIEDPRTWPKDDGPVASEEALAALPMDAGARLTANMARMRRDPAKVSKQTAAERFETRKEARKKEMQAMLGHLGLKDGAVDSKSDVVFFSVDVEAIEVSPGPVSEIGIAILDMQRVGEQSPGSRGRDWWPLMEAHHLRIKEYAGLTNYRYVKGCPDDFQFGDSTFPFRAEACAAVLDILRPYVDERRRIVLAGHDIAQDVGYMSRLGFDLEGETRSVGTVDAQVLHKVWMQSDSGRSLSTVLDDLGFEYAYLHNAGNDAVHTLRAVIGAAFAYTEPASPQ